MKEERYHRFMATQQRISAARLQAKVGRTIQVLIDEVDDEGAIGRSFADAPEIDGAVYLNGLFEVKPGDVIDAVVDAADEYDFDGPASALNQRFVGHHPEPGATPGFFILTSILLAYMTVILRMTCCHFYVMSVT